jgi:TonB dependent receptor
MIKTDLLKRAFMITSLAFTPLAIQAQKEKEGTGTKDSTVVTKPIADNAKENKSFGAMSLGIHAGSSGLGIQYNITLNKYFNGRLEGSYIAKKNYIYNQVMQGVNVQDNISVTTGLVGLFADFHSPKATYLNLTLGVVYDFTSAKVVQTATAPDSKKDLGTLVLNAKVNKVNPYVGLVWGNPVPKKKASIALELGTYYVGSPKITWVGTGIVGPTADQASIVENNIKSYSWLPVLSLHLNFKIN